jgi:hypothetical protein
MKDERYDVILHDVGKAKLGVVKVLKDMTGLGLIEAKEIVDSVPKRIFVDSTKADAERIQKDFIEAGATVLLVGPYEVGSSQLEQASPVKYFKAVSLKSTGYTTVGKIYECRINYSAENPKEEWFNDNNIWDSFVRNESDNFKEHFRKKYVFSDFYTGQDFTAILADRECAGKVTIENGLIFLCQDAWRGLDCVEKHGYNYSYVICEEDQDLDNMHNENGYSVRNLKLVSSKPGLERTASDINNQEMFYGMEDISKTFKISYESTDGRTVITKIDAVSEELAKATIKDLDKVNYVMKS